MCLISTKKTKYLVVRRASLHGNLLARQPDLVVLGKRTVLSVEPCLFPPSPRSSQFDGHGREVVVHGVVPRPQFREPLKLRPLREVHAADLRLHAHMAVGVGEQRLDTDEDLGDGEGQAPVVVDRVEAHIPVAADVRVKDPRDEAHNWRSHGIAAKHKVKCWCLESHTHIHVRRTLLSPRRGLR
jgi:hypothetical protein